jgi:hypothetical protein
MEVELPPNYKPTSLKVGPSVSTLDLGIHNVQGINVWANTAPRGWGSMQREFIEYQRVAQKRANR